MHAKWTCAECMAMTICGAKWRTAASNSLAPAATMRQPALPWENSCFTVGELADVVDEAFPQHFQRTSDQPSYYQCMILKDRESDYEREREGERVSSSSTSC